MMANLGMADTLILMVLALVVFGPRRLPQIGRQIGKLMYEFRKASNDFKFQMEEELRQAEEADRRKKQEEERQRALAAAPSAPQIAAPAESPVQPTEPAPAAPLPPDLAAESGAESTPTSPPVESPLMSSPYSTTESMPTRSEEPAETTLSAPIEPTTPRILPPSTGEKVAADNPRAQSLQRELFAPQHDTGNPEPAAPEPERSEPAAHHG
jgi:sec-independent protein translocase protein TatB